ncbi:MAG: LysR family transcriptional regulator [Acidimicrobiales bacterium]
MLCTSKIGKALGRSQGAVSNALARLEVAGDAQLVSASPRRYRITESR